MDTETPSSAEQLTAASVIGLDRDDEDAWLTAGNEGDVVAGLAAVIDACQALRQRRVALGLSLDDVAERCAFDCEPIEWVDEGDVAVPVEALVYYATALGVRLELRLRPLVDS
jgi:hypothetical protein